MLLGLDELVGVLSFTAGVGTIFHFTPTSPTNISTFNVYFREFPSPI
jgi:hypothetical protein